MIPCFVLISRFFDLSSDLPTRLLIRAVDLDRVGGTKYGSDGHRLQSSIQQGGRWLASGYRFRARQVLILSSQDNNINMTTQFTVSFKPGKYFNIVRNSLSCTIWSYAIALEMKHFAGIRLNIMTTTVLEAQSVSHLCYGMYDTLTHLTCSVLGDSFRITGLQTTTLYWLRAASINVAGFSEYSKQTMHKTNDRPSAHLTSSHTAATQTAGCGSQLVILISIAFLYK